MEIQFLFRFPTPIFFVLAQYFLVTVYCGDFIPERNCATLYAQEDFQGAAFNLKDFDVSADTENDFRVSSSGWNITSNIHINEGCSLYICSNKYFQGICQMVNANDDTTHFFSEVLSANCSCARECKCEDIVIPPHEYGRVYTEGGCKVCNAKYLRLAERHTGYGNFELRQTFEAYKMRSGCNLTVYSEKVYQGQSTVYTTEINETFHSSFGSYQISCNDSAYVTAPKPFDILHPPMVCLPEDYNDMLRIMFSNDSMANHPGFKAALTSLENERSSKNAYILLIGTYSVKDVLGIPWCKNSWDGRIRECRISVPVENLGVSNSELRVVYYDASPGFASNQDDDYQLMASLENYISNHDELRHSLPNAVVISHTTEDRNISSEGSTFQRKLRILNALRPYILDEVNSNVIFFLYDAEDFAAINLDSRVASVEKAINDNWTFSKPRYMVVRDKFFWSGFRVNGYTKMASGEYWPHNMVQKLKILTEKSCDPLGKAIFIGAYEETSISPTINVTETNLVSKSNSLVESYRWCHVSDSAATSCFNTTNPLRVLAHTKITETLASVRRIYSQKICNCTALNLKIDELEKEVHDLNEKQVVSTNSLNKNSEIIQAMQLTLQAHDETNKALELRVQKLEQELVRLNRG